MRPEGVRKADASALADTSRAADSRFSTRPGRTASSSRTPLQPPPIAPATVIVYNRAMTQSVRPVGPGDHVFLVDGSSFVFRAYFQSIRQDQKYNYRSDRLPVGAVRLFATKVLQFLRDGAAGIKPTHLAIIFDKSENSFRRELYPALQGAPARPAGGSRAAIPADARHRARLRPDADRAGPLRGRRPDRHLRAPGARARRRRADRLRRQGPDAARRAGRRDVRSGLGRPRGAAHRPEPRSSTISASAPTRSVDIQALAGDSTDNVPGAPGIGVKTAAQLIDEYGDLETLLARAGEIKQPKRRETLTNPETRRADPPLASSWSTLVRDVAVETPLDDARLCRRSTASALVAFLKAMEFTTITQARRRNLRPRRRRDRSRAALRRRRRLARPQRRGRRRRRAPPRGRRPQRAAARARAAGAGARLRRRSPPRARAKRARRHDRPSPPMRRCRRRRRLRALDRRARSRRASSPSTPRRVRSIRCRPNSSASRSPSRRARPATSRSAIAARRGRSVRRRRARCPARSPRPRRSRC